MIHAIILAGGLGERFWPLSRQLQPKQFLNVYSSRPLIEESIARISPLIRKRNIYMATGRAYSRKISKSLERINIPSGNILFEPESKNTFSPIAVLSEEINKIDPEAVIVVLPSDHFIKDNKRFLKLLRKGIEIAEKGYIVALGIPPKRPETGYGYIKTKLKTGGFYLIEKFIEKPDIAKARKFIRDKRYYWNGGIFIFSPQIMLGEIKKFMPNAYKAIAKNGNKKYFGRLWRHLPSISIDYAIMEKTDRMALLPADCGWIDLGSWEAAAEIAKKDKNGNAFGANHIDIGSKNTLVWPDKRLIATLGLDNIIIVDTQDALLVCRKDMSQEVKKIVGLLKKGGFNAEV